MAVGPRNPPLSREIQPGLICARWAPPPPLTTRIGTTLRHGYVAGEVSRGNFMTSCAVLTTSGRTGRCPTHSICNRACDRDNAPPRSFFANPANQRPYWTSPFYRLLSLSRSVPDLGDSVTD